VRSAIGDHWGVLRVGGMRLGLQEPWAAAGRMRLARGSANRLGAGTPPAPASTPLPMRVHQAARPVSAAAKASDRPPADN
jgi:hypothetical protein